MAHFEPKFKKNNSGDGHSLLPRPLSRHWLQQSSLITVSINQLSIIYLNLAASGWINNHSKTLYNICIT